MFVTKPSFVNVCTFISTIWNLRK